MKGGGPIRCRGSEVQAPLPGGAGTWGAVLCCVTRVTIVEETRLVSCVHMLLLHTRC
jgi:hypothetical protein